jgi:hypothetical protein
MLNRRIVLSMIFSAITGLLTGPVHAQDTNSDLYTRCPSQRQALKKYEDNGAGKCQKAVSNAAKCCNLAPGCTVQGIQPVATSGNVEGGAQLIMGLQALSAGLNANIANCDNSEKSTILHCNSIERGNTPADRQYRQKYSGDVSKLISCLQGEVALVQQQLVQAGGSVEASSQRTPTSSEGHELSAEEIVKALKSR